LYSKTPCVGKPFCANNAHWVVTFRDSFGPPRDGNRLRQQQEIQRAGALRRRYDERARQPELSVFADVDELCDRMAVLHEGQLRFSGTPLELRTRFNATTLEQAYLACIR